MTVPRYCLDTSWISNPFLDMPPDVHVTLWGKITDLLTDGIFCWNTEIWEELKGSIAGEIGECLAECNNGSCYEIGGENWDWQRYLELVEYVRQQYKGVISEYNDNRKNTVGLNDCSIVCLAKTLGLPVASMERRGNQTSAKRLRIPDMCELEGVAHFDLTELLRAEGITV